MADKTPASLYRRMRLVFDLELELPEEKGVAQEEHDGFACFLRQPQAVLDAILMRQAMNALQELDLDDLSELAGCVESESVMDQLLAKMLQMDRVTKATGVKQTECLAGSLAEHIRASLGVTVRQIVSLEPNIAQRRASYDWPDEGLNASTNNH